jgi:hypothetical protein
MICKVVALLLGMLVLIPALPTSTGFNNTQEVAFGVRVDLPSVDTRVEFSYCPKITLGTVEVEEQGGEARIPIMIDNQDMQVVVTVGGARLPAFSIKALGRQEYRLASLGGCSGLLPTLLVTNGRLVCHPEVIRGPVILLPDPSSHAIRSLSNSYEGDSALISLGELLFEVEVAIMVQSSSISPYQVTLIHQTVTSFSAHANSGLVNEVHVVSSSADQTMALRIGLVCLVFAIGVIADSGLRRRTRWQS